MNTRAGLFIYAAMYTLVAGAFATLISMFLKRGNMGGVAAGIAAEVYVVARIVFIALKIRRLPPGPGGRPPPSTF